MARLPSVRLCPCPLSLPPLMRLRPIRHLDRAVCFGHDPKRVPRVFAKSVQWKRRIEGLSRARCFHSRCFCLQGILVRYFTLYTNS